MKKATNQSTIVTIMNALSIVMLLIGSMFFIVALLNSSTIDMENQKRVDLVYNATKFTDGASYLTNEVRAYAATGNKKHYDNYWNEVNNLKNRDIGLENMIKIGITAEEQKMLDEMSSTLNGLLPLEEKAMEMVAKNDLTGALKYVYGKEYEDGIAKINSIKVSFLDGIEQRTKQTVADLTEIGGTLGSTTLSLFAIVLILQLANNYVVRKKVMAPIKKVQYVMRELSAGNLSAELGLEPNTSEIGRLVADLITTRDTLKLYIGDISNTLSKMADGNMALSVDIDYVGDFVPIKNALTQIIASLNDTLSRIVIAADQVASGSNQVASGSQALSQGTTEQASTIEQLSANVQAVSQQVNNTAHNSSNAQTQSEIAGSKVLESNEQMRHMIDAMNDINNKSGEISKIIKTIEDIAFQTNILALNAAVEAARAGAAGKGFAVVADEVRNLAGKSAEAAKNTTELIEQTVKAVENGTKIADNTATAMLEVVDGTKKVTDIILEIASASQEQADAVGQITYGIDQVSAVVQTNSATSEQSAAASEELSGQAQMLKELVSKFNLNNIANKDDISASALKQADSAFSQSFSAVGAKY